MRSRFDTGSEAGYAYYGGMLNAGYITGFARRQEQREFLVQQTNDPRIALPVFVEEKNVSLPQDTMPVKVVGRFLGKKLESGHRIVTFKAITLDRPSLRELPNRLAWEKPLLDDPNDKFKPFFDPTDDEDVTVSVFRKSDKKSGRPCLNVARLAGYVESFAYKPPGNGKKDDCLYIALRQTADPDESIPIRVYGRFADALRKQLNIGMPIMVEGYYRVKRENHGTPEEAKYVTLPYIFTSTIKVATPLDIKVRPAWWREMLDRTLRMTKERIAKAAPDAVAKVEAQQQARAANTGVVADAPAQPKTKPVSEPKPITEIPGL